MVGPDVGVSWSMLSLPGWNDSFTSSPQLCCGLDGYVSPASNFLPVGKLHERWNYTQKVA